jgi:hypothetical protein
MFSNQIGAHTSRPTPRYLQAWPRRRVEPKKRKKIGVSNKRYGFACAGIAVNKNKKTKKTCEVNKEVKIVVVRL